MTDRITRDPGIRKLTDFEKSLLGDYPNIKEQPIIIYRNIENVWACKICPSVTFHLYSDGVGRCIKCGFAPSEFVVAYPELHNAQQRITSLENELRELPVDKTEAP